MFGLAEITSNSLFVISPYQSDGIWVFDDLPRNLVEEPFVGGIPELIDMLVADIPTHEKGFNLIFLENEFPGYEEKLIWKENYASGNWYYSEKSKMEGWLCPALSKYFKEVPGTICVRADEKVSD